MAFNIILRADALRSLAFGSVTTTYVAVGTAFDHPVRIIKLLNATNADVTVSYDGVVDHEYIPAGGFALYDFCTNQAQTAGAFIAQGTIMYVKSAGAPSSGGMYISTYYGKGD
jgi:hypothetical protein